VLSGATMIAFMSGCAFAFGCDPGSDRFHQQRSKAVLSHGRHKCTFYQSVGRISHVKGMTAGTTKEQMHSPVMAIALLVIGIRLFAFLAVLLPQV